MNIVLHNDKMWYVSTLIFDGDGTYTVAGRMMGNTDSCSYKLGQAFTFKDKDLAIRRCKELAKSKMKHDAMTKMHMSQLPMKVWNILVPEIDDRISNPEAIGLIEKARTHRYVFFSDVYGMTEWFDLNVEYLAVIIENDEDYMMVYDRYGIPRECSIQRMSSITLTEEGFELQRRMA